MSNVVVTGAGRGIGRGIALRLARDGHAVAVNDLNKAGAEAVAEEITAAGGRAIADPTDVTDRDAVFAMVDRVADELGSVDVMVANAGIAQVKTLLEVTPEDLATIFGVNVYGVVYCLQAAAEKMIEQGSGGKIINAASIAGHSGFDYLGHYSATKFAVRALTQAAAKELAQHKITVNAYCPGIVGSEMWAYNDREWGRLLGDYAPGELMAKWVADIPMGRPGTNDDVADLLLFLASPAAGYITGQAINIDGGMFMS